MLEAVSDTAFSFLEMMSEASTQATNILDIDTVLSLAASTPTSFFQGQKTYWPAHSKPYLILNIVM